MARAQSLPAEPDPTADPIAVGATLTVKLARRGKPLTVATIKTVGRKWVTLTVGSLKYRFPRPAAPYPATILLDGNGYGAPGEVILDTDKVESDRLRGAAWRELLDAMRVHSHVPDTVSLEAIAAARKALGL